VRHFETKYGYFENNGNEYVIKNPKTPKPWINVISNGNYGLTISQTGGGFSWLEHSEFNRITRWHQDLVRDNWGKYLYIKDEESGEIWNPGWLPTKTELEFYQCRHGIGYSTFISEYKGISVELTIFVPFEEQHEIWRVKLKNRSKQNRKLSLFSYFEWCLGGSNDYHREFHKNFLETEFDININSLIAKKRIWEITGGDRGHWNTEYPYQAFHACNKKVSGWEGDKEFFLGQYGNLNSPEAIKNGELSRTTGLWNDSIGSLHVKINLKENQEEEVVFFLGLGDSKESIKTTLEKYSSKKNVDFALSNVKKQWEKMLGTLEIETPDIAMNFMVNKWLKYQAISGRLWARTAYYQQSGAYGFRDQLQDSHIFLPIDPHFTKNQIKLHAGHQFEDGSVLHWWHPITDEGLINKISDNLLWLPFLTISYLDETDNYDFLNENIEFYQSKEIASLFEHCCKAINKVLSGFSDRGLPLIGAGDWNDGMNAVGLDMKGESIWLAHFLYYILDRFSNIAKKYNSVEIADKYRQNAKNLSVKIEEIGWDGDWFFRATKDSGEKIGSKECEYGKIFLNPQTWSVISESASKDRQQKAMESVYKYLIGNNGPILFAPAYKKADKYIGYLSRYAPGSRENGGVYTHAATWSIWAFSKLKQADHAYEMFKRISPVNSGSDPDRYIGEPYVTPGNIDGPDSVHYGRGGWTWYTGSAAWFQKVIVDWIIGVRATEEGLLIDPCIPKEWDRLKISRLFRNCVYHITIYNPDKKSYGVKKILIDGEKIKSNTLPVIKNENCSVDVYI